MITWSTWYIILQDQRNASNNSTMTHTDITPPSIRESLLLRRLIFCTRLLISGNRSGNNYHICKFIPTVNLNTIQHKSVEGETTTNSVSQLSFTNAYQYFSTLKYIHGTYYSFRCFKSNTYRGKFQSIKLSCISQFQLLMCT